MVARSRDDVSLQADVPDNSVNRVSDTVHPVIDTISWGESVFSWFNRRTRSGRIIMALATLLIGTAYLIVTLVCAAALISSTGMY